MQQKNYQQEILALIHSGLPQAELAEKLAISAKAISKWETGGSLR